MPEEAGARERVDQVLLIEGSIATVIQRACDNFIDLSNRLSLESRCFGQFLLERVFTGGSASRQCAGTTFCDQNSKKIGEKMNDCYLKRVLMHNQRVL